MTRKSLEILSACLGFAVVASVLLLAAFVSWLHGFNAAVIAIGSAYGACSASFLFDIVKAVRRND